MRFHLLPARIRKDTSFQDGVLEQTLSFAAAVRTANNSYDQSGLSDGRKIDSLSCFTSIGVAKSGEFEGHLIFQPEYVSTEMSISSSGTRLFVEVYLAAPLFRELWATVEDRARIVFFGEVADMTSETSHSLSPYKWDISDKKDRYKRIKSFKFSIFTQTASDTESILNMEGDTDIVDDLQAASSYTASVRKKIEEHHNRYGQMHRLCMKAVDQTEAEAVRRGWSQYETESFAEEAVTLIADAYTAVRAYRSEVKEVDPDRLWVHQDILKIISERLTRNGSATTN